MVDFHTHILYDVDHGVQTKKQYTRMIAKYAKQGFDTVVLTPHLHHPCAGCKSENIQKNFEEAKLIAQEHNVKVFLGCELYFDGSNTELDVLPIAGRFLLLEFPVDMKPVMLEEKLSRLQERGYVLIIAHVERYNWLKPNSQLFRQLRNMGCLIQVNMESVRNRKAKKYLKTNMVDIIASDNHGDLRAPRKLRKELMKNSNILERMDDFYLED